MAPTDDLLQAVERHTHDAASARKREVGELLHPEDRERVLAAHQRTHATREPLFIEYRLRTRDGRYLWVQDEARVVRDGYQYVLQGYLLDITARKDAEDQ